MAKPNQDSFISVPLRLNSALDRQILADQLREKGRLQVFEILEPKAAARLYRYLKSISWHITFTEDDDKAHVLSDSQFYHLSPQQRNTLRRFIYKRGQTEFAYIYHSYPISDIVLRDRTSDPMAFEIFEFVNGSEFFEFVREISNLSSVNVADVQATMFRRNHFLTRHSDDDSSHYRRRIAYVLNLSRDWRAEWGGVLEFLDENGKVREGFVPVFNSLSLFYVPTIHHVSAVSALACGPRYAISGWLCETPESFARSD